jgi:hypothetical protein
MRTRTNAVTLDRRAIPCGGGAVVHLQGPTARAVLKAAVSAVIRRPAHIFERQNKSSRPDVTSIPATFPRVTVTIQ